MDNFQTTGRKKEGGIWEEGIWDIALTCIYSHIYIAAQWFAVKQYSAFPESLERNFGVKSLFW